MAKAKLTVKEIIAFIEKEGGRPVTEDEKKTDWYKFASKKASCFESADPRKGKEA